MFTMLVSIFTWVAFFSIWCAASVAVGIYIFINSRKQEMNTVLWVIIGLVFNIFGLCAYFIATDKKHQKICPVCHAKTEEFDTYCPVCDVKLETVRPKMKLTKKIFIGLCALLAISIIWSEISGIIMI